MTEELYELSFARSVAQLITCIFQVYDAWEIWLRGIAYLLNPSKLEPVHCENRSHVSPQLYKLYCNSDVQTEVGNIFFREIKKNRMCCTEGEI